MRDFCGATTAKLFPFSLKTPSRCAQPEGALPELLGEPDKNSLGSPDPSDRLSASSLEMLAKGAIHIAIHNNDAYNVLPMAYSAVRALLCR